MWRSLLVLALVLTCGCEQEWKKRQRERAEQTERWEKRRAEALEELASKYGAKTLSKGDALQLDTFSVLSIEVEDALTPTAAFLGHLEDVVRTETGIRVAFGYAEFSPDMVFHLSASDSQVQAILRDRQGFKGLYAVVASVDHVERAVLCVRYEEDPGGGPGGYIDYDSVSAFMPFHAFGTLVDAKQVPQDESAGGEGQ